MLINISLEYVNHCQSLTLDTDFFGNMDELWNTFTVLRLQTV